MDPLRLNSCIFITLLFTVSLTGISDCGQLDNDDVLGLMQFKATLVDPTNALRSWSQTDESPCYWTGISCDEENGRVIAIELQELSLTGHIGEGLDKLLYLQTLSLAKNNISGTIPLEITQLAQIRKLDLSDNNLSGSIVSVLSNVSLLRFLDLSSNHLSGVVPSEIFSNCKSLHYLSLAGNALDGSIPESIGSCSNLRHLNLSSNLLIGTTPRNIELLPDLSVLDLSYNSFSGGLPTFLPSLVTIRLQGNSFSGTITPQIGDCLGLQYLDLSNNIVSGSLPDSMQALRSLSFLNLAQNLLSGTLPSWLGSLTSLTLLNFNSNQFIGQPPSTLGLLKQLTVMDLSHNELSGEIPSSLSGCDRLKFLDLSMNRMNGTIPEILPPNLMSLRLSHNSLSGGLPDGFYSQCQFLKILDLSQNFLSGAPPSLASCVNLEYLNIAHNSFSGYLSEFPRGSLVINVDMGHNELSGNIPVSVGEATFLTSLLLDGNKLNGPIPHQIGNCSSLIDINFSQNNLSGGIPGEIGSLVNLEILDLSYNQFSGSMPPELGQLEKLASLNLSYNQLEGPIPDYGVLLRFNQTAFLGNAHLCGSSVNVTCLTAAPKPLVLDPNSASGLPMDSISPHKHTKLSISALLAICAAVAISLGVIVILVLNSYAGQSHPRPSADMFDISTKSPSLDLPIGKLVMFSKNSDPKSEEWVTSAHALLNKDTEMGRGGFGASYKAVLADGRTVVVKKLTVSSLVKSQHDFEKEIQFLGRIKHKNLLTLQGYYWTPQLQLLIYDFIPNGNLYRKLHENTNVEAVLNWPIRLKIALGIARGLAHLHGRDPPVIHFNMKSSNILLDERCNPKIADCGLANLLPVPDRYMMGVKSQNALGYMAPEYASPDARMNEKCDVYGYGIMLLELVTGRLPLAYVGDDAVVLCDYVRSLVEKGKPMICVDPKLRDYTEEEVLPIIKLGLICSSHIPSNRPSMIEVVQILELIKTSGSTRKGT